MNMPTNTKPWIQGAIVGAIALAIVGFELALPGNPPGLWW